MKIAYFITGLGTGGAEVITIGLANEMIKRGHDVMMLYLNDMNDLVSKVNPDVKLVGLGMAKSPISFISAFTRAAKLLKSFSPDVIHANMYHANVFARLLRLFVNTRLVISTEHNKYIGGRLRMLIYSMTNVLSDINTNVSLEATDYFISQGGFKAENSITMHNGVDVSKFSYTDIGRKVIREKYSIGPDDFVFINVGRLTQAKDQLNLIHACAQMKTDEARILIVGKGELFDVLEREIEVLGLGGRVILAGLQDNMADFYSAADCFVLSSAWEGLPMVILEAMAYSLPIITTNVGGAFETIGDPYWIVPVKNSLLLANKMDAIMLMDKTSRHNLGNKNKLFVSSFELNKICDSWEDLYRTGKKSIVFKNSKT